MRSADHLEEEAFTESPPPSNFCPDGRIDPDAIRNIIFNMNVNKAAGSNLVTNRLLRVASEAIVQPLTMLLQRCFKRGRFPEHRKKADVVPIPKKGGSSWRPISLLHSVSKIYKKVLADQVRQHLEREKLLSKQQFGFRRHHSTEVSPGWFPPTPEKERNKRDCCVPKY